MPFSITFDTKLFPTSSCYLQKMYKSLHILHRAFSDNEKSPESFNRNNWSKTDLKIRKTLSKILVAVFNFNLQQFSYKVTSITNIFLEILRKYFKQLTMILQNTYQLFTVFEKSSILDFLLGFGYSSGLISPYHREHERYI